MEFVNIGLDLTNGENMGGMAQTVIFGLWEDVAAWPTAPVAPADIEANAAWTGDVVMKAGKNAFTFYSTDETCELKYNLVGETDGKSLEAELAIFNPGLKKKILGFIAAAKNANLFLIPQDGEGQYYLLGDSKFAAKMISADIGSGKSRADRKGASLTFKFPTNCARVYSGDVTALLGSSSV